MGQASKEMPSTTTKANPRKYVKKENKSKKKIRRTSQPSVSRSVHGILSILNMAV